MSTKSETQSTVQHRASSPTVTSNSRPTVDRARIDLRAWALIGVFALLALIAGCAGESGDADDNGATEIGSVGLEVNLCARCNDGNPCTIDTCTNAATGACSFTPAPTTVACDDASACTTNDKCNGAGACRGTLLDCNDNNSCTNDSCSKTLGCTYANNTATCNDNNKCTLTDRCTAGVCQGTPRNCGDDGNPCTDECNPTTGSCGKVNNTATCASDDNACTDDVCAAGSCTHPSNATTSCTDGNVCTTADHCVSGACIGSAQSCDDGNPCTDDFCDPVSGCGHVANTAPCEGDGDLCTNDICSAGSCAHPPSGLICNDGNPCTDDACNAGTGLCATTNNSSVCNDGNACTTADQCSGGTCVGGSAPSCDDGNPCTTDSCNPATGCTHSNNTASCNDGNACTTADQCSGGACVGGTAPSCDDGNPCTTDSCNPASGCTHANNTASCSDGNACTTGDQCSGGSCVGGSAPSCDDSNPCTTDSCNPASGCTHANNTASCSDGNACTTGDQCSGGSCVGGSAPSCNDSNPCTTDSCNPASGCTHANNTASCSDGNACTTNDLCSAGACVGGPLPNCNDSNGCTTDACNPATGCTNTNNSSPCNDSNACTATDLCSGGACVGGAAPNCDDSNSCTTDACDPITGCTHTNVAVCSTDANLKVAFVGDTSTGTNWANVLTLIQNEGAAALVVAGDMSYSDNPAAWWTTTESVLGTSFPVFLSRGNHDENTWAAYLTKAANHLGGATRVAGANDANYKTTFRGLVIATIKKGDTASNITPFFDNDAHIWKICSWHQNQAAMQVGDKGDEMGWGVYEACRQAGAIIQTGHEHSYERTKTLTNMTSQTVDATCNAQGVLCVSPGRTFVTVSGLGGNSIRPQNRCTPTTYPYGCSGIWDSIYTSNQSANYGAQFITFNVGGDPKKASGYFKSIGVNPAVPDTFTITYGP